MVLAAPNLWLSYVRRALGWWQGHAADAMRRQQRAALAEIQKPAPSILGKPKRGRQRRRAAADR